MLSHPHKPSRGFARPADAVVRAGLLGLFWWSLNFDEPASWVIGVPTVLTATVLSFKLSPSLTWRIHPIGAIQFGGSFLWHSLLGGVDVARRVFHPRLPLQPGLITYTLRLPAGAARVFLANSVSLHPGTLSAELDGTTLTVHTLDTEMPVLENLQLLEGHVAKMLGLELAAKPGEDA